MPVCSCKWTYVPNTQWYRDWFLLALFSKIMGFFTVGKFTMQLQGPTWIFRPVGLTHIENPSAQVFSPLYALHVIELMFRLSELPLKTSSTIILISLSLSVLLLGVKVPVDLVLLIRFHLPNNGVWWELADVHFNLSTLVWPPQTLK